MKEDNLAARLKELPLSISTVIADACRISREACFRLYLAGGAVRDLLLQKQVCDIDLVVDGDAITLATTLAGEKNVKTTIHHRFATAKLDFSTFKLDITTLRNESYDHSGALPIISRGSLHQDLKRRDFTINAMAISLNRHNHGKLIDYYGGRDDLEKGLIRVLHDRSFRDDATRIWRALRFEQRLGFKLEENTLKLLKRDREFLRTISGYRLRYELQCTLREAKPHRVLQRATELGILNSLHPALCGDDWLAERFHRVSSVFSSDKLSDTYFCLLVYRLDNGAVNEIITKLKPDRRTTRFLRESVKVRQIASKIKADSSPTEIYHWLKVLQPQTVEVALLAEDTAIVKKAFALFLNKLRYIKVELKGNILKRMGIEEGKAINLVLNALLEARLTGLVTSREEEEAFAKDYITGGFSNRKK